MAFFTSFQGKGKTQTDRIFEGLIKAFAKRSINYIEQTGEAPFAYNERQLNSIIIPSLDELADALLMEHPVRRKYDKRTHKLDEHNGYIDCWFTANNQQYILELKHSFENINTGTITQHFHDAYYTGVTSN